MAIIEKAGCPPPLPKGKCPKPPKTPKEKISWAAAYMRELARFIEQETKKL
jgi:hypothetical protein